MKIVCKRTILNKEDLEEEPMVEGFDYTQWGLKKDQEYLVMGMSVSSETGCVYYLADSDETPNFFPYFLFEISDSKLPKDWYCEVYGRERMEIHTVWGFKEFCEDGDFYERIINEEETAIEAYFMRKRELEEQMAHLARKPYQKCFHFLVKCPLKNLKAKFQRMTAAKEDS